MGFKLHRAGDCMLEEGAQSDCKHCPHTSAVDCSHGASVDGVIAALRGSGVFIMDDYTARNPVALWDSKRGAFVCPIVRADLADAGKISFKHPGSGEDVIVSVADVLRGRVSNTVVVSGSTLSDSVRWTSNVPNRPLGDGDDPRTCILPGTERVFVNPVPRVIPESTKVPEKVDPVQKSIDLICKHLIEEDSANCSAEVKQESLLIQRGGLNQSDAISLRFTLLANLNTLGLIRSNGERISNTVHCERMLRKLGLALSKIGSRASHMVALANNIRSYPSDFLCFCEVVKLSGQDEYGLQFKIRSI